MDKVTKVKRPYRLKDRINEVNYNKNNSKMTIIEYVDCNNIVVQFEDGYKVSNNYSNFKKGLIKNPYDKTIYGIGYIGIDDYSFKKNISSEKSYQVWRDILYRCYGDRKNNPTYIDCSVCEEWLNYNNFKDWYENNHYEISNEKIHIDKDILVKNNKIYSPNTCIFVPQTINQVFQTFTRGNKTLPIGVVHYGKTKYIAIIHDNLLKQRVYSIPFNTIKEAHDEYIKLKRDYIFKLSQHYEKYIPIKLYSKLIEYSV